MDIKIGEMTIGGILNRGMTLLFKRLTYFYAIELTVLAPLLLVQLLSPFLPPAASAGAVLLVTLLNLILALIGAAAVLRIIVQEYLDGQVSLGEAFQFALGRFLPLLGTSILCGLLITLGLILCVVPGVYLAIVWCMTSQVVVVENISGMDALNRSKKLTEGYFGHVFSLLFLLGVFQIGVVLALTFGLTAALHFQEFGTAGQNPFLAGGKPVAPAQVTNYANYAIVTVATTLVSIFLQAYSAICITLMYFDLRNRKEGYDLPMEFAKIAAWRERLWDADAGGMPLPGGPAPGETGIKEPGTHLPPPPETGIQEPPP